jgi:hypothetical protein
VQAVEIRPAVDAEQHGLAVDHEGRVAVAQGASVISGKRPDQSWPFLVNSRARLPCQWMIRR